MGSLRSPVGPLPSSIYWRRRAVLLVLVLLMALLVTWAVTAGDSGDPTGADDSGKGGPASSITPGPSGSGPAISEHPGGRDETETGGSGSGSGGSGGEGSGGSGDTGGSGDEGADGGSGEGGSDSGGSSGKLPAGSALANCPVDSVELTLRSVRNEYAPGENPEIVLTASTSAGKACAFDLGGAHAVVTLTEAGADKPLWSSAHCPKNEAAYVVKVPADGEASRTLTWNRKPSAPDCAKAKGGSAAPGTYVVDLAVKGLTAKQASFVLAKD